MKKIICIVGSIFMCVATYASQQVGVIEEIRVRDDGLHWVTLKGSRAGKPSCAQNNYFMIKDENSTYGKSQFSILLAAKMSNEEVIIVGKGICTRWGDGEDIGTIVLK